MPGIVNLILPLEHIAVEDLDALMRSQFGTRIAGITHAGATLYVHFFTAYSGVDQAAAQAIVDAHDPVILEAARSGDVVTVQVWKPRNLDAAPSVTMTVNGVPGAPISLVNNQATETITAAEEIMIGVVDYPHDPVRI